MCMIMVKVKGILTSIRISRINLTHSTYLVVLFSLTLFSCLDETQVSSFKDFQYSNEFEHSFEHELRIRDFKDNPKSLYNCAIDNSICVELHDYGFNRGEPKGYLRTTNFEGITIDSLDIPRSLSFPTLDKITQPKVKMSGDGTIIISDSLTHRIHFGCEFIVDGELISTVCYEDSVYYFERIYEIDSLGMFRQKDLDIIK